MKGDRIVIQTSMLFQDKSETLPVYNIKRKEDGSLATAYDGSALVEQCGGVKVGSTGVVQDVPIKVHKTLVWHLKESVGKSLGGAEDYVLMYPIFFDHYQQLAWVPSDHMRITAGGRQ